MPSRGQANAVARSEKPRRQQALAGFEEKRSRYNSLVPRAGIEPARLAAGDFESPASTNFTTWAGPAACASEKWRAAKTQIMAENPTTGKPVACIGREVLVPSRSAGRESGRPASRSRAVGYGVWRRPSGLYLASGSGRNSVWATVLISVSRRFPVVARSADPVSARTGRTRRVERGAVCRTRPQGVQVQRAIHGTIAWKRCAQMRWHNAVLASVERFRDQEECRE